MRLDWDQYFLGMAHWAAIRSHDSQTQVGCIIVNSDNHIISIGYNGFPAKTNDTNLPTVRPGKYPFMLHAEQNAISNMLIKQNNLRAYITANPCSTCAKLLWQNDIKELIVDKKGVIYSMNQGDIDVMKFLIENGLKIRNIDFNQDIFAYLANKLRRG
jgi:dCMP deaminase